MTTFTSNNVGKGCAKFFRSRSEHGNAGIQSHEKASGAKPKMEQLRVSKLSRCEDKWQTRSRWHHEKFKCWISNKL